MKKYVEKFDQGLESLFKQAPKLPKGLKKFLVEIAPWFVLLGGIMIMFNLLNLLRFRGFGKIMFYSFGYNFGVMYWISVIIMIVMGYIDFKAFKPLKSKKIEGWKLMWYLSVFSLVRSVLTISLFSAIFSIIGFYVLYEVKEEYK